MLEVAENGERVVNDLVRLAAFDIGDETDAAGILVERRIVQSLRLRQPDARTVEPHRAHRLSPRLQPSYRAGAPVRPVGQRLDRSAGCLAGLACTARLPRLRLGTNVQAILGELANWDSNAVLIHHAKF
jgi:hypothetical protein